MSEEQPDVEQPVVEALVEEPKTYTQEDVDTLRTKAEEEAWSKYQGIQRTIAEKDRKLKEYEQARPVQTDVTKAILDELGRQSEFETDPERQTRIATLNAQLAQEKQMAYQDKVIRDKRNEVEGIIRNAGLNPDDEAFEAVWDAMELTEYDGKLERVDRKLEKALSKTQPKPIEQKPKEESVDIDMMVEEKANRKLKEEMVKRGLLTGDDGKPSAPNKSLTAEEVKKMSPEQIRERGAEIAKMPLGLG